MAGPPGGALPTGGGLLDGGRQGETPARVDECLAQARALRATDPQQALALCRQAGEIALRLDYQGGLAWSLLQAGQCLPPGGLADATPSALMLQALSLFEGLGDRRAQAEALLALACDQARRGEQAAALAHGRRGLALRQELGDLGGQADALIRLGAVLRDMGRLADALEWLHQALDLALRAAEPVLQGQAHSHIGLVLAELGELPLGEDHHRRALALLTPAVAPAARVEALLAHAELLGRPGSASFEAAQVLLVEARQLAGTLGQAALNARVLLAQGRWRQTAGEVLAAAQLLVEALAVARRLDEPALEAEVLLALGRNRWLQGEPQAAVTLLAAALQTPSVQGADRLAAPLHELLSTLLEAQQQWREALHHYKAWDACRQRLLDQDNQRRIRQLLQQADLERVRRDAETAREQARQLGSELHAAREAERQKQALLEQLERQSELLRQLSREDGLTGLANRRWLDAQLTRERERARRYRHPLAVAMVDLDHFKRINDRCSHPVGDEVLRRVGLLLRDACRSGDIVGRYGGEEFMVVLVETPLSGAHVLCEKLRQRIAALDFTDLHPSLSRVTASIGVSGDAQDPVAADLVRRADQALYQAKATGRNRVCVLPAE
ncbi:tetratricopeptide repeat-containing diguanylate cyclase [Ideonella livida]|uniref:diguanylate cyclase n=1 Tax=Ideonella livida TaxID=2707176 RepID=A0A7C9PH38_9BURK|nr:tetratricopeptide repeat-containing diguanylate cyclase [Ideonella livida]NDY91170.1 diguanylate cyclase [Ideonella livida]